ncbi:MAG: hypothetical protein K1X91_12180 [Bacteriodetes bacterium]|nr:hypothetical protein [Bacteroidota bacterium]
MNIELLAKFILEVNNSLSKDNCFTSIAIRGGFEEYYRDKLYESMFKNEYQYVVREYERVDLVGISADKKVTFLLELKHNGCWQGKQYDSLPHRMCQDSVKLLKHKLYNKSIPLFQIGILTEINSYNLKLKHLANKYIKIDEDYLAQGYCESLQSNKKVFRILKNEFGKDNIKSLTFETPLWNSFQAKVHIFLCQLQ